MKRVHVVGIIFTILCLVTLWMTFSSDICLSPNGFTERFIGALTWRQIKAHSEKSLQADCLTLIQHNLYSNVSASSLRKIFESCTNATNILANIHSHLFINDTFQNGYCPRMEMSFSTIRRPRIALASFPGSGNTWTRHLIERITGLWTGSIYVGIVRKVLLGEKECPTSPRIFIIKTHKANSKITINKGKIATCVEAGIDITSVQYFEAAILILRSPFGSALAEFNLARAGKVNVVDKYLFNTTVWTDYAPAKASHWRNHALYWLTQFGGPLHVVFYEDLRTNLAYELYRMATFLQWPVTYQTLWCTLANSEGVYHREKPVWFGETKFYNDEMKANMTTSIKDVETALTENDINHRDLLRYIGP